MEKGETHQAQALLPKIHFNLGGHNCHDLYWKNLAPKSKNGGVLPKDDSKLS
jgi:Fe-Mn family superoxide dismutase